MTSLRAARYRVKNELLLLGYPCPGCWEPITPDDGEFHHALFREGQAYTEEQKAFLYDARNGTLVHHSCHMDEGFQFRLNCAVMIVQRSGTEAMWEFINAYADLLDEDPRPPDMWVGILGPWRQVSKTQCPACLQPTLHSYITGKAWATPRLEGSKVVCWNCLWRNWIGE